MSQELQELLDEATAKAVTNSQRQTAFNLFVEKMPIDKVARLVGADETLVRKWRAEFAESGCDVDGQWARPPRSRDLRELWDEARNKGREEGRMKSKRFIARNLLTLDWPIGKIADVTGTDEATIRKWAAELAASDHAENGQG